VLLREIRKIQYYQEKLEKLVDVNKISLNKKNICKKQLVSKGPGEN